MAYFLITFLHAEVEVSFRRISYTFVESEGVGTIEVVKNGVSSAPFDVRITGGKVVISELFTQRKLN